MDIASAGGVTGTALTGAGTNRQAVGDAAVLAHAPRGLVADSARLLSTSRRSRIANPTFAPGGTGLQQHQRVHDAAELDDVADSEDKFSHYDASRVAGNQYGFRERNRDSRDRRRRRVAQTRARGTGAAEPGDLVSAVVEIVVAMPSQIARAHHARRIVDAGAVDPAIALMLKALVRTAAVVKATRHVVGPPHTGHATPAGIRIS